MDLLRKVGRLEARLAGVLDKALNAGGTDPLEIVHAIVARVSGEIQPIGRGKHVFPFNQVEVLLVVPSAEARARMAAVIDSEPSLEARIVDRLRAGGCPPLDLTVNVTYVPGALEGWPNPDWHVQLASDTTRRPDAAQPAPAAEGQRGIELTIASGVGRPEPATFAQRRVDLGRCEEVRDSRNRLIRTNHVVFTDAAGPINDSVSRRHAHIEFSPDSNHYRLFDDGSAHGTGILRAGKAIVVPPGPRGVRLETGDRILLGEAQVKVRFT